MRRLANALLDAAVVRCPRLFVVAYALLARARRAADLLTRGARCSVCGRRRRCVSLRVPDGAEWVARVYDVPPRFLWVRSCGPCASERIHTAAR